MTIRAPKDFWSGLMFIAFAAVALLAAGGYSLGSAGKMGPGYFPLLLGRRARVDRRDFGRRARSSSTASVWDDCISSRSPSSRSAVCLFAFSIETLGLVIALAAVTFVSALASRRSSARSKPACSLPRSPPSAVGVFVYVLRLPLPVWPAL